MIIGIGHLWTTVVIHWCETQFTQSPTNLALTGTIGIITHKNILLVQMRSHTVDANHRLQTLTDAIIAVLTMHISNTQAHATNDGIIGTVRRGLITTRGSQTSLNTVYAGLRTVIRQFLHHILHFMSTLFTAHSLDAHCNRVSLRHQVTVYQ